MDCSQSCIVWWKVAVVHGTGIIQCHVHNIGKQKAVCFRVTGPMGHSGHMSPNLEPHESFRNLQFQKPHAAYGQVAVIWMGGILRPWVRNLPFFSPNPMDSSFPTLIFHGFTFQHFPKSFQKFRGGPSTPRHWVTFQKFHGIDTETLPKDAQIFIFQNFKQINRFFIFPKFPKTS